MKMGLRKDRKTFKGPDGEKIARIWAVLARQKDWMHVSNIARQTHIHEATVRWYLDNYMTKAIEETRIDPSIRLRLVRLKPGITFNEFLKALELIQRIREEPQTSFGQERKKNE